MTTNFQRRAAFIGDDRKKVVLPISTPTSAIEVGDFVYWNGTAAISFLDITDQGTKAQNQAYARAGFVGVAMTRVAAGTTSGTVTVATEGQFRGTCTSGTYKVGDLIGPEGTGSGGNVGVSATTVVAVANASLAIGRVTLSGTTVTTLTYEITGTLTQLPPGGTALATDTIAESTPGSGVTIDGALLQDGGATFSGPVGVGAAVTITGALELGGTNKATIKGIYHSGTIAVTVPTIANDVAENVDSVDVDISSLTFAAAVGDAVIANPLAALPTDCLLVSAIISATDTVRVTFASKEAGAGVTGAAVNFSFLIFDLT